MSGRDTKVFEVCNPCGFESVYAWRQFDGEWPNGLGKKNDKWCTWEDHHNGTDPGGVPPSTRAAHPHAPSRWY